MTELKNIITHPNCVGDWLSAVLRKFSSNTIERHDYKTSKYWTAANIKYNKSITVKAVSFVKRDPFPTRYLRLASIQYSNAFSQTKPCTKQIEKYAVKVIDML